MNLVHRSRPRGITAVAFQMILFGLAEVVTGFTHKFFTVSTAPGAISAYAGAAIGILYAAAGLLVLPMKKWAAKLAIGFLAADVLGRAALAVTGLFPVDSPIQAVAMTGGTAVMIGFAIYILSKWAAFD